MLLYKHYSFDLWLTLIKSNPLFKQKRCEVFYRYYNSLQKSINEIASVFRHVDLVCNSINEKTGGNIDANEMYLMVLGQINGHEYIRDFDLAILNGRMEQLFFEFKPQIYNEETLPTLALLKATEGVTLSLLSNTGFIKGSLLRTIIHELGMSDYFEFQLYSDEENMSKPNAAFFELMINRVASLRQIGPDEIVHIGDNPHADCHGAKQAGINSILINSDGSTITSKINHATQEFFLT